MGQKSPAMFGQSFGYAHVESNTCLEDICPLPAMQPCGLLPSGQQLTPPLHSRGPMFQGSRSSMKAPMATE